MWDILTTDEYLTIMGHREEGFPILHMNNNINIIQIKPSQAALLTPEKLYPIIVRIFHS